MRTPALFSGPLGEGGERGEREKEWLVSPLLQSLLRLVDDDDDGVARPPSSVFILPSSFLLSLSLSQAPLSSSPHTLNQQNASTWDEIIILPGHFRDGKREMFLFFYFL